MLKFVYYPGCSLESTAKEYDLSLKAVCQSLGVKLEELHDWNCCGASSGHATNYLLSHALAGRNLALAEREGLDRLCQEACPNEIPVFSIFRLVGSRVQKVLDYLPGRSLDEELPLATFKEVELPKVGYE